jgi:hypothetical protein
VHWLAAGRVIAVGSRRERKGNDRNRHSRDFAGWEAVSISGSRDTVATQEESIMNQLAMADVREASRVRGFEKRLMADRLLAIAFFLAAFAVEIAIVQFAGSEPPLALDGQPFVVPIT